MLENPELNERQIYIFADSPSGPGKIQDLNSEVINIVLTHRLRDRIRLFQPQNNVGVKNAVPMAIEWAMSFEIALIILEDDCIPKAGAFEFFDKQINNLDSKKVMVCGSLPQDPSNENSDAVLSQLANYPLIWGWATNRSSWNSLRAGIDRKTVPWVQILAEIGRDLSKTKGILFFAAAVIRVNRGQLKAWDSPLALHMLINDYKSILPTVNLITNTGDDEVASHPPRISLPNSKRDQNNLNINKLLESKVYDLRNRHLLSPVKAYLEPLFFWRPKKIKILRKN